MSIPFQVPLKKTVKVFLILLFSAHTVYTCAQQKIFNKIDLPGIPANTYLLSSVIQDAQGYIWITTEGKGLLKYDGSQTIAYTHNDKDTNSITSAMLETLAMDRERNIWIGSLGGGMDKFDPTTNRFTHFWHKPNDPGSLSEDTVTAILEDHLGNLWIGTHAGLDRYDQKTGKFIHYAYNANDPHSLSGTHVRVLCEDKEGNLWVGCGSPFPNEESWKQEGGLNLLNRATGKFTRFLHDPNDPGSIANNKVRALLQDSKGNFWVGTAGDGLQILNRQTGKFIHYYYDSTHPNNLSRGPLYKDVSFDHITFIKEDTKGKIWIGTFLEGIVEYDPATKKVTHHGYTSQDGKTIAADTLTGFNDNQPWLAFVSKDGLLWITTLTGNLYNINPANNVLLSYDKVYNGNAFYKTAGGIVWIATSSGLIRKDEKTGIQKVFVHNPNNSNSLSNNVVYDMIPDKNGRVWIGTVGAGLDRFDPATNKFTKHHFNDSIKGTDSIQVLYADVSGNLWIGTQNAGVVKIDKETEKVLLFKYIANDSSRGLVSNGIAFITGDRNAAWVATRYGLDKIETASGRVVHYLPANFISSVLIDNTGIIWAGTQDGLYEYNSGENTFTRFKIPGIEIRKVISLNKDKKDNIWISSTNVIIEIKNDRNHVRIYNADNGIHANNWTSNNDYISSDDEVFMGDATGYYHFYPDSIKGEVYPPIVNFASLQIGGKEVQAGKGSILDNAIYNIKEIKIPYNKSSFSIGFSVIDFRTQGEKKVVYMLENYDNQWHETNADNIAYFYNLPGGNYTLRVRATNAQGAWSEKTLAISIMPPWWQTWWAIALFIIALLAIILGFSYYRSVQLRQKNKLLEEKVKHRTAQLQQSLENLKSTQNQLVQQEKMASLGELTAGIAHEIQNPLNFVNNFSEVNKELLAEMKNELNLGNTIEAITIANNLEENEEKINHHGKRADAIVKNMLQHSRSSSSQKELTDINKLADEYLRLSYHGLRAKDKQFNADFKTDFDESIGKINIVPPDIGRVLLNLYNNAFYAVNERLKQQPSRYEPTITAITKRIDDKSDNYRIELTVKDNGSGIPQKVVDKIFQPFFTTKPPGEGTGLGLSLSYDIIKTHGGEIKVKTKEGEGSEFIISLPLKETF